MKCQVCNQDSWFQYRSVLKKCTVCGFVRASDRYFKTNTKNLYSLKYYEGIDYLNYKGEELALRRNFQDRLQRILDYKRKGKLLEIGSAYGFFLDEAKAYFDCLGVDVDPKVAKWATKLTGCRVTSGEFLNMKFPRSSFDVICMFDTIEHLKEPKKYIQKINTLLKKGGIVAIETGDIDAILPKIQKDRWRLITPPYHLAYFSKKTLTLMLEAQQFRTKTINYVPFYRTLGQTLYRLNRKITLKPPISDLSLPINVYDLIFGIWQKTDIN